jgi:hypothetical protein
VTLKAVGTIWRASSPMRVWWRVICSPQAFADAHLASVSASIWLVLACRLKNLRRSDALADETR